MIDRNDLFVHIKTVYANDATTEREKLFEALERNNKSLTSDEATGIA